LPENMEHKVDAIGAGMSDDVVQRLAGDQYQRFVRPRWQLWLVGK
jgi:hypothetical protein